MKKSYSPMAGLALTLGLLGGLLCSCTLPSEPPATVTSPDMLALFQKAKADDPNALYTISKCYEKGSSGFPKSGYRASLCLNKAAYLGHKRARAERAHDEYFKDDSIEMKQKFAAKRELEQLAREGESYAIWALEDIAESEETVRQYYKSVNCSYCKGSGRDPDSMREVYYPYLRESRVLWDLCRHCNGTGRKDKRRWNDPTLMWW